MTEPQSNLPSSPNPPPAPKQSSLQEQEARYAAWAKRLKDDQKATGDRIRNPEAEVDPAEAQAPPGEDVFDLNLLFTNSAEEAAREASETTEG